MAKIFLINKYTKIRVFWSRQLTEIKTLIYILFNKRFSIYKIKSSNQ